MYPVSESYKTAVNLPNRNWHILLTIETAFETLELTESDILEKSLKLTESVISGSDFSLGGVAAADFGVTIINSGGQYTGIKFNGATLHPQVGLEVSPGVIEWVPLGVFIVDTVSRPVKTPGRPYDTIVLQAADRLIQFDTPFADMASITFPCTVQELLTRVCAYCGVILESSNVLNKDYIIAARPEGTMTCRDVLSYIAEISCSFARCNRSGHLELNWFKNPALINEGINFDGGNFTDYSADNNYVGGDFLNYNNIPLYDCGVFVLPDVDASLLESNRITLSIDDTPVEITGVTLERDDVVLLAGGANYTIALSNNPFIQDNEADILKSIWNELIGFTYITFNSDQRDDPSFQAGDLIETYINGQLYRTILTSYSYVFGGKCTVDAVGASQAESGYIDYRTKQNSQLIQKIVQKQLDTMQHDILNASQMIAGVWGGYVINGDTLDEQYHGNIFISDNQDITQAVRVWRWNLGGLGYSENGIEGPYQAAFTADGNIVASLVTANMVTTGILRALNGSSYIDLDTGAFSFANGALTYDQYNGFNCIAARKIYMPGYPGYYALIGRGPNPGDGLGLFVVDEYNYGTNPFFKVWMDAGGKVVISARDGNLRFANNDANNTSIGVSGTSSPTASFTVKNGLITDWNYPINGVSGTTSPHAQLTVEGGMITGWDYPTTWSGDVTINGDVFHYSYGLLTGIN